MTRAALARSMTARRIAVVLTAAAIVAGGFAFLHAGRWLIVESPLQRAPVAVVFGGKTPFRAAEAARLYRDGWTREVWVTQGRFSDEDATLAEMGIERMPDHVVNQRVLEHLGVPGNAIRVLPGHNNNTAEEVRTIARAAAESHVDRIILISSSYHTRRVRALWRTLAGGRPEAIVHYARDEQFDAAHWYRDTADAWSVSREWFGLLNAWAGFPVRSEHW